MLVVLSQVLGLHAAASPLHDKRLLQHSCSGVSVVHRNVRAVALATVSPCKPPVRSRCGSAPKHMHAHADKACMMLVSGLVLRMGRLAP